MSLSKTTASLSLVAAAAALFSSLPLVASAAETGADTLVHCHAINACRGNGNCKTVEHKCQGQNECKGQSWVPVTKKICDQLGGVTRADD
jgi:uncharacterized membrane protein